MIKVWYFTVRGDEFPLGFFTSRKKVEAQVHKLTDSNPQAVYGDYEIKSREVR